MERNTKTTIENIGLLKNPDPKFKSLCQGEHEGVWYFGKLLQIEVEDKEVLAEAVITSNKDMFIHHKELNQIKKDFSLNFKNRLEMTDNYWSNEAIQGFIKESLKPVDKDWLYDYMRKKILHFMDFTDKRVADLGVCYTIGTYCYELFESFGYLWLNGFRESGKSKFKKILGLMSFNAINSANLTEASLYRTIENTKPTFCIDEFEHTTNEKQKDLNQILNAGITKGEAKVRRQEKIGNTFVPYDFDVYCPKIICSINDLHPVTATRCIKIKMLKTKTSKGKRKPRIQDPDWQMIRDYCYELIMNNWQEIKEIYEEYDFPQLKNRAEDIWKPIFVIARFFGKNVEKSIAGYSDVNIQDRAIDDTENDWRYVLLESLYPIAGDDPNDKNNWMKTNDIVKLTGFEPPTKSPSRYVGRMLSKMNLFPHRRLSGGSEWLITKPIIVELLSRFEYPIPDLSDSSPYPGLTTLTTQTTQTTLNQKWREEILKQAEKKIHRDAVPGLIQGANSERIQGMIDKLLEEGLLKEETPGVIRRV